MPLSSFVAPVSYRAIAIHGLSVFAVLGAIFTVPCAVALIAGELVPGLIFLAIVVIASGIGLLRKRYRGTSLEMREALVLTALSYLTFALAGGLPFLTVAAPMDALFEAMSGFTTTGLSTLDPERLPTSLVFFRSYAQWLGGAGIIVLSLALIFGTGKSSRDLYASELGQSDLAGSVRATARIVVRVYLVLTAFAIGSLLVMGVPPFEAVVHALSTVSTGGFSSHGDSVGAYASTWSRMAFVPVMLLGATSLPLFYRVWQVWRDQGWQGWRAGFRAVRDDVQLRALLVLSAVGTGLVLIGNGLGNVLGSGAGGAEAGSLARSLARRLEDALFHVVSALSTTGYATSDARAWSGATLVVITLLMIIGGSGGSTAGGLKLRRFVLLLESAKLLLTRSSLPREAVIPLRHGGERVPAQEERLLLSFLSLYLIILLASTLLLVIGGGFEPWPALFESASALSTVGLSIGITSPELAPWLKAVLIFDMWAGRLEILPVLLVLRIRTWKPRGESP